MQLIYGIMFAVLVTCIALVFKILPGSPFLAYLGWSDFSDYLPYINYFVPVDAFIVMSEGWLACITVWFIVKFAIKAINTVSDLKPL